MQVQFSALAHACMQLASLETLHLCLTTACAHVSSSVHHMNNIARERATVGMDSYAVVFIMLLCVIF